MHRTQGFLICLLLTLAIAAAACSNPQVVTNTASNANAATSNAGAPTTVDPSAAKSAPADVLTVRVDAAEAKAGGEARVKMWLKIKEGYHINANPPSQYQIATELKVEPTEGIQAGKISYPPALNRKFKFSKEELAVYEGEISLLTPLTVNSKVAKGQTTLPAKLRFQACDDEVCYPPRTIDVSIPVNVK
jgi:DsbC/DsbD-like thiol-disulfide interchange protein